VVPEDEKVVSPFAPGAHFSRFYRYALAGATFFLCLAPIFNCKTIPGLQYAVKWKQAYYGLPQQGWIIEMVAYDVSVNVVFFGGADFDPPPPLGTGGRSRYVKLKTLEEAQGPLVRKWIEEAGGVRGWKC
jgi:hypothetical protein